MVPESGTDVPDSFGRYPWTFFGAGDFPSRIYSWAISSRKNTGLLLLAISQRKETGVTPFAKELHCPGLDGFLNPNTST